MAEMSIPEALVSMNSPPPSSSFGSKESNVQSTDNNPNSNTVSPSLSPSVTRLWRPAAQRNLRNQWSKLLSFKQQWVSASSSGRSHATSLVNAYLSQRYMPAMDLGVLTDMPDIRNRACYKLALQQEFHGRKILSSYKDMVAVVAHMVNTCSSMRRFLKGPSGSPHVQFSSYSEDKNDSGDGGGIPVFTFWPIPFFENLGQELFQMFALELSLKRCLLVELLSLSCEKFPQESDGLCWSNELYPGEFNDLTISNLYSKETCQPLPPRLKGCESGDPRTVRSNQQPREEILQVYITAWLAEVNIDMYRVDEIFATVGEEMHVSFS
ncbi:uncharacterized protein LOC122064345 [Macadamia integrifolia]|uniref:uncharacterized protein LOC122064345 n=1 Tax=Macadamia integrifolia TaxID=60698 RepID=UPI001C4F50DF|nr:uncharacterized protein LOC122064345 [Macadamia integrifolia]